MNSPTDLSQQIQMFEERVGQLRMRWPDSPGIRPYPPEPFDQALAELTTSLEELRVMQEEVRERSDELARLHAAHEAEKRRYRDIFASYPDGLVVTDPAGNVLEMNRTAEGLLGQPSGYVVGKPLRLFIEADDQKVFDGLVAGVRANADLIEEVNLRIAAARGGKVCRVRAWRPTETGDIPPSVRWIFQWNRAAPERRG